MNIPPGGFYGTSFTNVKSTQRTQKTAPTTTGVVGKRPALGGLDSDTVSFTQPLFAGKPELKADRSAIFNISKMDIANSTKDFSGSTILGLLSGNFGGFQA